MLGEGRITAIAPTKRDPDRASIRVDAKHVATVSYKHVNQLGLHVGQAWTPELADQVAQAALYDKAMKRAMNRLNRRAMSRRELDRKLKELEFDEGTRERVLDRLTELNLLNDEAFGRAVVRETMSRKAAGKRLLQQKLFQKGIDRKLADRILDDSLDPEDQAAQALTLASKRLKSLARFDAPTRKRRLYGLLARRGFDPDTIDQTMRALAKDLRA